MRFIIIFATTLFISTFAFAKTEKMPTSNNNAKVRFYSPQEIKVLSTLVRFRAKKGDRCFGSKELLPLGVHAPKRNLSDIDLGMLKEPGRTYSTKNYFEIAIPANTKFVFEAEGIKGLDGCRIRSSFVPLENMEYEVTYTSNANICVIRIDRIQIQDGKFVRDTETSSVAREPACSKW